MAQPYCTGSIDVFAGVGQSGAPAFLGHSERGARIQVRRHWEQVLSDVTGSRVPLDVMYEGQDAIITMELTRFNEGVLELLQATPLAPGGAGVPGVDIATDRGTLMILEGMAPVLWTRFAFGPGQTFPKLAMANPINGPMPGGYRWAAVTLDGPDDMEGGVGSPRKVMLVFHAWSVFNPATGAHLLYDQNMIGLGAIN